MPYKDKEKQKAYQRKHYEANRENYNTSRKISNAKIRENCINYIEKYLSNHPCVVCGESDPIVLEFHHRDSSDKKGCIADLVSWSLNVVIKEIEKCDVMCANCHRRVTHKLRNT
jgi:hypothetical protein